VRFAAGGRLRPSRPGCPRSPAWPTATSSTASKPRLTSAGIGYLARLAGHRPLLLDVDDWEVGFLPARRPVGHRRESHESLEYERPYVDLAHGAHDGLSGRDHGRLPLPRAAVRRRAHPHVRDTDRWAPGRVDPDPARERLGVDKERVVMFLARPGPTRASWTWPRRWPGSADPTWSWPGRHGPDSETGRA